MPETVDKEAADGGIIIHEIGNGDAFIKSDTGVELPNE